MKITFVLPFAGLAGGVRVAAIYAQKLTERGHDVTVISQPAHIPSKARKLISTIEGKGSGQPRTQTQSLDFLGDKHIILDRPRAVVDADVPDADIVIATWWQTAFYVASLSPEKGKKFYFVQHHEVHKEQPWQISRGSYYLPLKKITISNWLVDTMANVYGDTNVALVHNSVDMGQFFAPARQKQKKPTIGFLYSSTHFKGVDISLRAIEIVRKKIPDLKLQIFGSGQPVPQLPLPEGTTYQQNPPQDQLRDIYAACDVWLCGSRAEGFHLPPLEAMACRCPVVSTRVGGPTDIINNGQNGYLVDVEDSEALADRLIKVLSMNTKSWQLMSDAALATAEGFTWDDATDLFEVELLNPL